jgi:hypothetical protein
LVTVDKPVETPWKMMLVMGNMRLKQQGCLQDKGCSEAYLKTGLDLPLSTNLAGQIDFVHSMD